MPEGRPRYRLSVNPALEERLEDASRKMGIPPQQVAYVSMGLGLRMLEQLMNVQEMLVANPGLMQAIQPVADAEADDLLGEMGRED